MPELPEVEVVRRGLQQRIAGARLGPLTVREGRLRLPVPVSALQGMEGRLVDSIERRGKYLLLSVGSDWIMMHLGMSGQVLVLEPSAPLDDHDHLSWTLSTSGGERELRFRDPRRFGLVVPHTDGPVDDHRLLHHLGPEPLSEAFTVEHLCRAARGRRRPVKNLLMDARVVAGMGNIYASEALWYARINPRTAAGRIAAGRWERLRTAIRQVLEDAIEQGGTTLRDFRDAVGEGGYFQVRLRVYDREGEPCHRCQREIRRIVQAGRSTFYCTGCQT